MKIIVLFTALLLTSTAFACTGFFDYEVTSGSNKICYYQHLGSTVAINVKSYKLCPITIKVKH